MRANPVAGYTRKVLPINGANTRRQPQNEPKKREAKAITTTKTAPLYVKKKSLLQSRGLQIIHKQFLRARIVVVVVLLGLWGIGAPGARIQLDRYRRRRSLLCRDNFSVTVRGEGKVHVVLFVSARSSNGSFK